MAGKTLANLGEQNNVIHQYFTNSKVAICIIIRQSFPHQNTETIISPKFYSTRILHYTVYGLL